MEKPLQYAPDNSCKANYRNGDTLALRYHLGMSTLHLDKILNPSSIVVVGASARESSPGFLLTQNILQGGYTGTLHLVNPRYREILGQTCHRSLKALPQTPDLAFILTPARLLRRTLVQCSRKGVRVVIVMSGVDDSALLHRYGQRLNLRIMGPWCAGLIRPSIKLNATYSRNRIEKGSLALASQSASLGATMLDWAETSGVGFSTLLSTGDESDITLSDTLDLLAEDGQTRAVIVYVEKIKTSRALLSALSATARIKPVILMRSSHESVAWCDVLARTGKVHSSDSAFQAALNRAGVVRIRTFHNLFAAALTLATGIRLKGKRLGIVCNAQAPAMIAVERMALKHFQLPALDRAGLAQLEKSLGFGNLGENPIVLRHPESLARDYRACIDFLQSRQDIDAVLVIFVPDWRNEPTEIAEAVKAARSTDKPLLACWMGDANVRASRDLLSHARIPSFRTPEGAIDGFDFLHRYLISQQQLLQLPGPASRSTRALVAPARHLIKAEVAAGQRVLGTQQTQQLMQFLDIPLLPSQCVQTADDAVAAASHVGYPLSMQPLSTRVSEKLSNDQTPWQVFDENQLRRAFNQFNTRIRERAPEIAFPGVLIESMHMPKNVRHLAVSIARDQNFGPVLSIGIGGDLGALLQARAVQLPPLNRFLIDELMQCREIMSYMGAYRQQRAVSVQPVTHVLRQLSELACELPEVFSVDINPLVVSDAGAFATGIQVVLEKSHNRKDYDHLAIHPYPWHWVRDISLKHGTRVQLRPIRPEDAESIQALVRAMSPESRYFRFLHTINELSPLMAAQFTKLDYDRQMAFVATDKTNSLVGVCRYMMNNDRTIGDFGISIGEDWKGRGLASAMMRLLIEHAREQGLQELHGDVLRSNQAMQHLMRALGFSAKRNPDDPELLCYGFRLNEEADTPS